MARRATTFRSDDPRARSHLVPRFMLAGFAAPSGDLFVNVPDGRTWRVGLDQAGTDANFYAEDIPGIDGQLLTDWIADLEEVASPILEKVVADTRLPDGEDLTHFLKLVALEMISGTRLREYMIEVICSSEGLGRRESLAGMGFGDFLNHALNCLTTVIDELLTRSWSLLLAERATPEADFVCSDAPVSALWTGGEGPPPRGVGSQAPAILTMPIDRRLAIQGTLSLPRPVVLSSVDGVVAKVNSVRDVSWNWYGGYVFSPAEHYLTLTEDGRPLWNGPP